MIPHRFMSPVQLVRSCSLASIVAVSLAISLGGCVSGEQNAAPAQATTATPGLASGEASQGGGACGVQVARLQRILAQDREMGHINARVYQRMAPGVEQAAAKCRAGDQNGALALIATLKRNNGYY